MQSDRGPHCPVGTNCYVTRIAHAMGRHPDLIRRQRRAAGLAPGQSRAATIMLMRVNRRRLGKKVAGKYETETP